MPGEQTVATPETVTGFAALLPEAIQPFYPYIEGGMLAIVIFIIGWIASKWANGLVQKLLGKSGKVDKALGRFLGNIVQYAVLAAAIITALGRVGVETTSLVAIFASAGLAVGLALQGSLSNFASGVMILFFRPFNLEDIVTAGGATGVVKDIGIFATTFNNPDNDRIIIPNSKILGDTIINHTVEGKRRASIDAGVGYGVDLQVVEKALIKAAGSVNSVLPDPGPAVAFVEMAASSLNFKVHVWCKSEDYLDMIGAVRTAIYNELNAQEIDIPFDQIVVHNA